MIFTLFIALVAILFLVGGQTLLKVGLNDIGGVSLFDGNLLGSLLGLFRTPWIILGFVFYGVSAILWLDVLSKLDFSMAFPMVSLSYVLTAIFSPMLLGESFSVQRFIGILVICLGVFLVSRTFSGQ